MQSNESSGLNEDELEVLKDRVFYEVLRRMNAQESPVKRGNQRAFLRFG